MMDATGATEVQEGAIASGELLPVCGIVRPIAAMGEHYPAAHWSAVHAIVAEALSSIYRLRIVSETEAAGVILADIVYNLFSDEVVVFDVSGRNPNVMFELGLRMAFQKPAVIIVDDDTPYSFDISPIKHLQYPKSMRYADMVRFKEDLLRAVQASVAAAATPNYRGYLQQFGPIKVTHLDEQQIDVTELASAVQDIKRTVHSLSQRIISQDVPSRAGFKTRLSNRKVLITISCAVSEAAELEKTIRMIAPAHLVGVDRDENSVTYNLEALEIAGSTLDAFQDEIARRFPNCIITNRIIEKLS